MTSSGFGFQGSGFVKSAPQTLRSAAFLRPEKRKLEPRVWATSLQIVLAFIGLSQVLACGPKLSSKPDDFFPATNEVEGWSKSGKTRVFAASRLWEYIDGDAERYLQAGVQRTLTADYRYQENVEAVADVYVMTASKGARKIFESESSLGGQPIALGDAARLSKGNLTFRKGPYLVRLVAYQDAAGVPNALVELAKAIEKKLGNP